MYYSGFAVRASSAEQKRIWTITVTEYDFMTWATSIVGARDVISRAISPIMYDFIIFPVGLFSACEEEILLPLRNSGCTIFS